jgi:hypothetical protein
MVANEFTSETQVSASVTELSPNGTLLSGPTGYTGAGRTTRVGALRLDKYSRRLDRKCSRLEQIGSSLQEGLLGWYIWAHKQEASRIALSQATPSLRSLCQSIRSEIQGTDNYIATFEAMKGVSRDMNGALERHIQVLRRIRNANSNILIACTGALNIADSALSSEQPRHIPASEHEVAI